MKTKNMKTKFFLLLYLVSSIASFVSFNNYANVDDSSEQFRSLSDDEDALDIFDPSQEIPDQAFSQGGESCITAEMLMAIIGEPRFNLLNILQRNLFLRTNRINTRSLLDLPALQPYYYYNDCYNFTAEFFYNQTRLNFFTPCCPFINSYMAFEDKALSDLIKSTIDEVNEAVFGDTPIPRDLPEILTLFGKIKLEQRRIGMMFGFAKQADDNWFFSIRAPFYYLENNFFLTNSEINAIKDAQYFKEDGIVPDSDQNEAQAFFIKHLLADKIGIGDTRINFQYQWLHDYQSDSWFGLLATIPTGAYFKRGLIGGCFDDYGCTPKFDLLTMAQCFTQTNKFRETINDGLAFLTGSLDRLTTMVADQSLGNGGSLGWGPKLDVANYINFNWTVYTCTYFEFFTKQTQIRYFLVKKDPAEFDRDLEDPSIAEENVAFLNRQIDNTFYPQRVLASVKPGWLFRCEQALMMDGDQWHARIGWDYWRQASEAITLKDETIETLDIPRGLGFSAYEVKLFSSIAFYSVYNELLWHLMVNVDGTIANRGIGKGLTLGLRFGIEF